MRHGHLRQPRQGRTTPPQAARPRLKVTRTYLELPGPSAHRRAHFANASARVARLDPCTVADYRWLYAAVGADYHWHDRDAWSDEQLAAHLAQPGISVWLLTVDGERAGYFELSQNGSDVEIAYFGLVGRFIGQGLGKALLSRAVDEAYALGATRVWLHTCTLDGPAALPNYKARGFVPFRTEEYEATI